jgi:hypothetical protein
MKKSELFKLAQLAVLNDEKMTVSKKKEVLELLLWEESFAKIVEEKNEQENAK